eukprot:8565143-Alexandrium_andersonii.AAC.1
MATFPRTSPSASSRSSTPQGSAPPRQSPPIPTGLWARSPTSSWRFRPPSRTTAPSVTSRSTS